jgi:hypothetical protein
MGRVPASPGSRAGDVIARIKMAFAGFCDPSIIRTAEPVDLIQLHGLAHNFPRVRTQGRDRIAGGH